VTQRPLDHFDDEQKARLYASLLLAEKQAAMSILMSGFAHDAGTPLMAISSITQLLDEKIDDPYLHEKMTQIRQSADRISQIMRNMVDFARPIRSDYENVYLNAVIMDAVRIVRHDRRLKYREINTDLMAQIPQVRASADQLLQIFIILSLNAAAALERSPQGTLTLSSWHDRDWVMASVADTGEAASGEERDYSPFTGSRSGVWERGAGLYVAQAIITTHGGRLEAASEPGTGNRVVLALPALAEPAGV
jgi:signal transduction histidine kinase